MNSLTQKRDYAKERLVDLEEEIRHFCEDCPDCVDCGGCDDAYGAPMWVEELTCPADGDPENNGCTYHKQYADLLEEHDWIELEVYGDD